MAQDDWREQKRRVWDALAPAWERHRVDFAERTRPVSEWLVEHLDARPGDVILELAAGTGETGFLVAPVLGHAGRLISTDLSPAMLQAARNSAAGRGVRNVEFRVADLLEIPLEDASVDGVLCRWGYQQVPDPGRALREAHRVLRRRRRICISVWADGSRNPLDAALTAALAEMDAPATRRPAPYSAPVPALETAEEVGMMLCEADLVDVLVQEHDLRWRFADGADLWAFVSDLFGGAAMRIAALEPADRATVHESLVAALAGFRTEHGGYDVPALCLNATAACP
ncbi:MAG: methyltransferase domain-containing protein [Acidimicrobiia bacterium]|nr:methyltransferase domain-containing protein [Acidimicrobiia bacterium]